MLNFAIIGYGGLGKVHCHNVATVAKRVKDVRLVAVCDVEEEAFRMQKSIHGGEESIVQDLSAYRLYQNVNDLLEKEQLDFVITALPTYLHEEIAVLAMKKGIHVFSEKPMAISLEQAENMLYTARENNVKLMIGHCVRYMPEYLALKNMIQSKQYGKVIKADFFRYSTTPEWSWKNWMLDISKSGGACLDLHVHDVDYINYVFGLPKAVSSHGTNYKTRYESITTVYHYDNGMLVTSNCDWAMPKGFPFTKGFTVRLEKATVVFNAQGLTLYDTEGQVKQLDVPNESGYAEEIVDFIQCIQEDKESTVNPPEASLQSMRIALAEMEAVDTGKMVCLGE